MAKALALDETTFHSKLQVALSCELCGCLDMKLGKLNYLFNINRIYNS